MSVESKPRTAKGTEGRGVIGSPIGRVGGYERVTGTQQYVADYKLPEMLHAKLVHLDCAHAKIKSIDTGEAAALDGVRGVFTAQDLPQPVPKFGPKVQDRPVIADGETRFHGEPVAIVVAEREDIAEYAATLVKVDYDELPAVLTLDVALEPEAILVQEPKSRGDDPHRDSNIHNEWHFGWGDVDAAQADVVVENSYTFPMITHFAIEPFTFMVAPSHEGMTVYSATQNPNAMQQFIATVLDLPLSRVRVIAPDPGGAFGGKQHPKFEPLLALIASRIGRPIRLALTLEESFQAVRRAGAWVNIRTGMNKDGSFVFQDIEADFLIGAYVDIAARVVSKATYVATGPYRVPNVRIVSRAIFSHTTPTTAFRGFGIPQTNWALESNIDEAARRLNLDRVELRRRNIPERGEVYMPYDPPCDGVWTDALDSAAKAIGWGEPLPKGRGRGLAMGMKVSATTAASYSIVRLHYDGSATVLAGTSDMGQGARTVYTQIAAQEFGLPIEKIGIVSGDTAGVPFDLQTSASRSAVFMGNAVLNACRNVKDQLRDMAAEDLGVAISDIEVGEGVLDLGGRTVSFGDVLKGRFGKVKGEVIGIGSSRKEYQPEHPLGGGASFYEIMCTAVEVEVDEDTGFVRVRKLVNAGDVGKALNPQHVEMQDDGAATMGLGHSLMEHLIVNDHGRVMNLGALDYRIPTSKDVPPVMESILIENGDGPGPYGAKGCGEGGILAIASAVGAAVREATGAYIRELPLTPERVWRAMAEGGENPGGNAPRGEGSAPPANVR